MCFSEEITKDDSDALAEAAEQKYDGGGGGGGWRLVREAVKQPIICVKLLCTKVKNWAPSPPGSAALVFLQNE